jgi:trans enoyl reductase
MGDPQRELDVVIYGATGFVGKLTAQYLARVNAGIRIALAGRSAERLEAVRQTLGVNARDWPVIVADVSQPEELTELAARTQVVASAVGPYLRYGLPIVGACAAVGTDYVDLTGEVPFVRASIDLHHKQAVESGARIVHSCGFDSVPSDLTVYSLYRRAVDDDAGELGDTTFVLRGYSGGFSSGSAATMVDLLRISSDSEIRRLLDDPYSLSPDRGAEPELGPQADVQLRRGAEIAPELAGLWTGGYVMAAYNTRAVRRTNALLGWAYGRRFRYSETLSMGTSGIGAIMAATTSATIAGATRFGGAYLNLLPRGLVESMTPASGLGYRDQDGGYYKVETYTETTGGARYVATMTQQADPGYTATAMMLGESALALAKDRDRLSEQGGVLTPATAMGDVLLARLAAAGVTIDTARLN